jgi:hypothetical protein
MNIAHYICRLTDKYMRRYIRRLTDEYMGQTEEHTGFIPQPNPFPPTHPIVPLPYFEPFWTKFTSLPSPPPYAPPPPSTPALPSCPPPCSRQPELRRHSYPKSCGQPTTDILYATPASALHDTAAAIGCHRTPARGRHPLMSRPPMLLRL